MKNSSSSTLYLAILMHSIICILIFNSAYVTQFTFISDIYSSIGFTWPETGGKVFSTLLIISTASYLFAIVVNAIRSGWPAFNAHDRATLSYSLIRLVLFFIATFVAVGLFGYKANDNSGQNIFEFFGLALAAIIFAGIVMIFDDAFGAVYIHLRS